jgi:hypothetical protein
VKESSKPVSFMSSLLPNMKKTAAILAPKKHIYLLSHMRAYTSLFGHIMGSNPAICGYYEMHIGYYSWKSPIRQKLLYFQQENPKPGFSYMFDKILHNEHSVSLDVLNGNRARPIFCLRQPKDVIPSILKLYARIDPTHEFNGEAFATDYYIKRVAVLEAIAESLEQPFFYFDSDSLKRQTEQCLGSLSEWLQLATPLSDTYSLQKNTSRERYGDSSEALRAGRIRTEASNHPGWSPKEDLLHDANTAYREARSTMIKLSRMHSVVDASLL